MFSPQRSGVSRQYASCFLGLALLVAIPIKEESPWSTLWTFPAILAASMMIAWAAESAQFFVAQGFALAILAWLQTLPEFAVEAVIAWKQQIHLMLANLTGALRLLVGLGWPLIYFTAAGFYRYKTGKPLRRIVLDKEHAVEVVGLAPPLAYFVWIWWKASIHLYDAAVLIVFYVAYLLVLRRLPPQEHEKIEDMEQIPRYIMTRSPRWRTALIVGLFAGGGVLIYYTAEPFLGSLLAVSSVLGISSFIFVQWVAPLVSEFPEKVSAFYWARTVNGAPMALMNMVSSNINQWTLLAAMLPIVYSLSRGAASSIPFNAEQELEILMTMAQSLIGMMFLMNMEVAWWEATVLFVLWAVQFVLSPIPRGPGPFGWLAGHIHWMVTWIYLGWSAVEVIRILAGKRQALAFSCFIELWRKHGRAANAA
ncbi:MAG: hypothetical protein HY238_11510 [Acidobacteria bacterium]|nr:hypothetical protein [Acidobacteriota bacterium]